MIFFPPSFLFDPHFWSSCFSLSGIDWAKWVCCRSRTPFVGQAGGSSISFLINYLRVLSMLTLRPSTLSRPKKKIKDTIPMTWNLVTSLFHTLFRWQMWFSTIKNHMICIKYNWWKNVQMVSIYFLLHIEQQTKDFAENSMKSGNLFHTSSGCEEPLIYGCAEALRGSAWTYHAPVSRSVQRWMKR